MNREELIKKITTKKDFSELPKQDVELAFNKFNRPHYSDEEKVKLTRDLLRKVFSVFTSWKLLNIKDKDCEWILNKHISTRERLKFIKMSEFPLIPQITQGFEIDKLRQLMENTKRK